MTRFIAAFPMYDWPEVRPEVDAQWARLRDHLRRQGIDAPKTLVRRNADIPAVRGGICDAAGAVIAPDPAALPPDELNLHTLWLHPQLLIAQACWGPMELGLSRHVQVVAQPDYSAFEGGQGEQYSSAIVMRRDIAGNDVEAPPDGAPLIPLGRLRGKRFAYNSADSMSGRIALARDLNAAGASLDLFSSRVQTGGHRASMRAVAEGRADLAAVDCRSWDMARRFDPAAKLLSVVGWTARRKGLPYVCPLATPPDVVAALREAVTAAGMAASG